MIRAFRAVHAISTHHVRKATFRYPQINEVGKSDHVVLKPRHETEALPIQSRSNLQQGHVTPFITLRPRISEGVAIKATHLFPCTDTDLHTEYCKHPHTGHALNL